MLRVWTVCLMGSIMLAASPVRGQPTASAPAQRPRPKLAGSEILLELDRRLKLTDAQQEQLMRMKEAFQMKHAEELKRLRDEVQRVRAMLEEARENKDRAALVKARNEVRELRDSGEKLRRQFELELLGILTSEQKAKYEKLAKERENPRRKLATDKSPAAP